MKKCIVIPTYWGPINENEEIVFDHPTPLNSEGTLNRLLENLLTFKEIKNKEIPVRIISVSNRSDLNYEVEKILTDQIKSFEKDIAISLYSYSWLDLFKKEVSEDLFELINPVSYSQIRNLSLFAALETDADIGIFLDDDEVLIDEDYFDIAEEGILEKALDNGKILGKVGWYDQERTDFRSFWELKWWPKDKTFNEAFDRLMKKEPRFKASLVGLGGNMVMTRELMKNICFDPKVNRGEDMDYVLNSRFKGYRFYFDPELRIKHLPPQKKTPQWKKAREDIYRFLFMRDKYETHFGLDEFQKVSMEELDPYPGTFLKDDLEERIFQHNRALGLKYLSESYKKGFDECMENTKIPFAYKRNEKASRDYLHILKKWKKLTDKY